MRPNKPYQITAFFYLFSLGFNSLRIKFRTDTMHQSQKVIKSIWEIPKDSEAF